MSRRFPVGWAALALVAAAGWAAAAGALGQSDERRLEEVGRQMESLRVQIAEARTDQSEYAAAITATGERLAAVAAELVASEAALAEAEGRVADKQGQVEDLDRKVARIEADVAQTGQNLRRTRESLRERAAELYMGGFSGWENTLFGSDAAAMVAVRLEYGQAVLDEVEFLIRSLEVLERQEREYQAILEEERSSEVTALRQLEEERAAAESQAAAVAEAKRRLREELTAQEELLSRIRSEIAHYEGHLDALEEESEQLELEILRRQIREGRAPGRLAWPVQGRISSPYGWRIHPVLGGRRMHTGVDVAAPTGTPILAAAGGRVIMAERWGGYGRAAVVDHGGGLSTIYAHQSSIAVAVGQEVRAGDVIGYVGCSGYCTGPHLHFEVRELGAPVDPMTYLN